MEIPKEPNKGKYYALSAEEINCLNYYCVFKVAKTTAVKLFLHPDLTQYQLKQMTNQFFGMRNVLEYIQDYNETLADVFENKQKPEEDFSEEDFEARKQKAVKKAVKIVCDMAEKDGSELDIELFLKCLDKVGLLDEKEEQIEQPRRYLPEICSACRYRAFCEEECEDLCQRCKYKTFANEQGVEYTTENQLSNEPKG